MKKPTQKEIEKARQTLIASGIIDSFWHVNDIIERAKENNEDVSKEDAIQIGQLIARKHDANIGINWEVIDIYTNMYFNTK